MHIGAIFIAAALILVPVIFTFRNGTLAGGETSVLGTGGVPAFEIPPYMQAPAGAIRAARRRR